MTAMMVDAVAAQYAYYKGTEAMRKANEEAALVEEAEAGIMEAELEAVEGEQAIP